MHKLYILIALISLNSFCGMDISLKKFYMCVEKYTQYKNKSDKILLMHSSEDFTSEEKNVLLERKKIENDMDKLLAYYNAKEELCKYLLQRYKK